MTLNRVAPLLVCAALSTVGTGCYKGEWKLGPDIPVGTKHQLLPTRDVETWQVEPTVAPYVVRVHAALQPRCRAARYGSSRRSDVGTFRREGAGAWRAASIATSIAGATVGLAGASGWLAQSSQYGAPAMYAVGGLLSAGGLVNCILAAKYHTKVRYALCGSLLGSGVSLIGGVALSQTALSPPALPTPPPAPALQYMTYAGAATLGAGALLALPALLWKGETHRTRVVEQPNKALWDTTQPETTCGSERPLVGRTATLELIAERAPDGPGSEADPLKLRVALTDEGSATVDLRPLRQGLADCGVVRVQLSPDTLYDQFAEDWVPTTPPQADQVGRPIHGLLYPREGFTLRALESKGRKLTSRTSMPGIDEDLLGVVGKRCRAEIAREGSQRAQELSRAAAAAATPVPVTPAPAPVVAPTPTPVQAQAAPVQAQGGDCSAEARQIIQRDGELSCGKSLEISQCVFDRRKCLIDARYSTQKARDEELCELSWEKCLFKVGIGPGAWGRCVESYQKRNEPAGCAAR